MKIDKRKKYYFVFDVETTNNCFEKINGKTFNDGLVYDIGFVIRDKKGKYYEKRSYVISDIFDDYKDLMKTAYYSKKLPQYYEQLEKGERVRKTIFQVRREIHELLKKYNINEVYAYNSNFDMTTLNNTVRYLSKSLVRYFFPYGTKINCIWNMACQVLYTQKRFLKQNIVNAKGNLLTSAERGYQYISFNVDFIESHTGLEDSMIESDLLLLCLRQHKKMDRGINRLCWRIPNKAKKELLQVA